MTRPSWWSSWHIKHTAETIAALRARVLAGETQALIAKELGIDRKGVNRILFVREGGEAFRRTYIASRRERVQAGLPAWRKATRPLAHQLQNAVGPGAAIARFESAAPGIFQKGSAL
jgi:hypothetical protein